jgi:hypothetical protein
MGNEEMPEQVAQEPSAPARRAWWRRLPAWALVTIAVAPVVAVTAVAAVIASSASASPFESALDDCRLSDGRDAQILDDGKSLLLDMEGEESRGLSLSSVACVLQELDVPESTMSKMDSTRALDGRQSDEFNGITVEWTYHPSDGMDVLFTR